MWRLLVNVHPDEDRHMTAFSFHYALYGYNGMPFGLTKSPAISQRAMDIVLPKSR